jgi:hypothetical protein
MTARRLPALALLALIALLLAVGCGEKIAIPEPEGLYSVAPYRLDASFDDDDPRQLTTVQGILFVLNRSSLTKRDQNYAEIAVVEGLADPRALCSDDAGELVFVWDEGLRRVSWYGAQDLSPPDGEITFTELPAVQSCVGMATSRAGVEQVPGAVTYLYLADPDSGVVHRYAYDPSFGLVAHGILCRSDGDATRFVHEPGGLARDLEDSLLVCDRDPLRNWVIRFDAEPDLSDIDPNGIDPLRGRAALFGAASCNPPAAADYVLGDAAECDEAGWEGGTSDALGEFNAPAAVAVDGSGRIYVSDTGNDRFQIFGPDGIYEVAYGNAEETPAPGSLAVVDVRSDENPSGYNRGAFLFAVSGGQVRRYISGEHYLELYGDLPPPEG